MDKSIDINGQHIHYEQTGDGGRPVIVMHGWGCDSSTVALLAKASSDSTTTVYNIDMPGFGKSPEPVTVWGVEDYTAMLEAFVERLGIERPVLIGHSFGGRIAIMYGSRNETDRIILVDAAGIKPRRSLRYYIKVYTFKLGKRVLPLILGRKHADVVINGWRGKAGSSDYASASPQMRAIMSRVVNEDLTPMLHLIKAPTLLIWGERDTATPFADAKKMEKLIPDAGLVSYPEAGHYSFLDRPAQTSAVIANFLDIKPL